MRNPSKKMLKRKAYNRYFDAVLINALPLPSQVIYDISEDVKQQQKMIKTGPLTAYFFIRPPRIKKRFKSSRQDWRFWYYYY